jgi:hypothetical protein
MPESVDYLDIIDMMKGDWYKAKIPSTITKFDIFLAEKNLTQSKIPPSIINLMWDSYNWRKALNDHLETTNNKTILETMMSVENIDISNYNHWSLRYFTQTDHDDFIHIIVKHPNMNLCASIKDIVCSIYAKLFKNKIILHKALGYKFFVAYYEFISKS